MNFFSCKKKKKKWCWWWWGCYWWWQPPFMKRSLSSRPWAKYFLYVVYFLILSPNLAGRYYYYDLQSLDGVLDWNGPVFTFPALPLCGRISSPVCTKGLKLCCAHPWVDAREDTEWGWVWARGLHLLRGPPWLACLCLVCDHRPVTACFLPSYPPAGSFWMPNTCTDFC